MPIPPEDFNANSTPSGDDLQDMRIGELLNDFFDRRGRGEAISIEDFAAAHPEHASELRQHFEGLRILDRIGGSSDQTVARPAPGTRSGSGRVGGPDGPMPIIDGYELMRELGRGGMGIVFKAMQKSTKRVVALKVLLEGPFASESARRRFEREIALAASLRHANIVPIYDSGSCSGRMYYAMEYVHGKPLGEYIRANTPSIDARLRLFARICSAVSHAHMRGVIHRDLKPANILVDAEGSPLVHDFGLAKAGGLQDMQTSVTAQIIGTPAYMSPEQVSGDPTAVDQRSDVYSLGVILYEMLVGQAPYPTDCALSAVLNHIVHTDPLRPSSVNRKLDDDINTMVLKALAKRKDERYQSVGEFAADIERFLNDQPIAAKPAGSLYLIRKALRPHRHLLAAGTLLLLVLVVGGFLLIRGRMESQQREAELQRAQLESMQAKLDAERQMREKKEELELEKARFYFDAAKGLANAAPEKAAEAMRIGEAILKGIQETSSSTPQMLGLKLGLPVLQSAAELAKELPATQPTTAPAVIPEAPAAPSTP